MYDLCMIMYLASGHTYNQPTLSFRTSLQRLYNIQIQYIHLHVHMYVPNKLHVHEYTQKLPSHHQLHEYCAVTMVQRYIYMYMQSCMHSAMCQTQTRQANEIGPASPDGRNLLTHDCHRCSLTHSNTPDKNLSVLVACCEPCAVM